MLTRNTAASITVVLRWRFVRVPTLTRTPWPDPLDPVRRADALVGLGPNLLRAGAAGAFLVGLTDICTTAGVLFVRSDPA